MTGHLERPSQETLETRKAINRTVARRVESSPHTALRSLHAAERALLVAAHHAAVADKRSSIAAAFSALLSAAEHHIIAHVQGRMAAIDPQLSLSARMAEIERLRDEQEAALARLRQDIAQERRDTLRTALGTLSSGYRRGRIALARRQQADRARFRQRISAPTLVVSMGRRWPAIRVLAARIRQRRHGDIRLSQVTR